MKGADGPMDTPQKIRIFVADDHHLFRKGLIGLLQSHDGFEVVGEASSGRDAVQQVQALKPDVVLLDVYMPDGNGIEAAAAIAQLLPSCHILMLSASADDDALFQALEAGADGYLLKDEWPEALFEAIEGAMHGEAALSPDLAERMLRAIRAERQHEQVRNEYELTPRETEILSLLVKGASNKEIAAQLFISPNTVKNHLHRILEKLHAKNRTQAVSKAEALGIKLR